jgi:hypothetical protein
MNSCSPRWMHIKLTLYSESVGEELAASRLACKCGPPCKGHLHRWKRAWTSLYKKQTHTTVRADFVVARGNLKSP